MLPIQTKLIAFNKTYAPGRRIDYIIIHDTGNRSTGANALAHYNYFNTQYRGASADFFVDDNNIIKVIDYKNYYSWAVGDGHGAYGITNANSVSIEICINADGDYNKALANALDLALYLMKELGLGLDKVCRHFDASRKNCPQTMNVNGDWIAWTSFKNKLASLNSVLQKGSTGSVVVDLQNKLNFLRYNCGIADGIFGNGTYNAVVAFQKDHGLTSDGVVGSTTMASIDDAVFKKKLTEEAKKVKNIVIYNNYVDKRAAEYLADFLGCATVDGTIANYDYSTVENIYGVGGGTFPSNAKIVKGTDRYDTVIAVLKQIGKL